MNIKKCPKCSSRNIKKIENVIENKDSAVMTATMFGK